jgi:hypothetical protein
MLSFLLALLAFVVTGACAGPRRFNAGVGVKWIFRGMFQQAYGARGVRAGGLPGGIGGCRWVAAPVALARPAPRLRPESLDGWSGEYRNLR